MKWTPQKAITSAFTSVAAWARGERVADEVGEILHFRVLVVVRQQDGVAFAFQLGDRGFEIVGKLFTIRGIEGDRGHVRA